MNTVIEDLSDENLQLKLSVEPGAKEYKQKPNTTKEELNQSQWDLDIHTQGNGTQLAQLLPTFTGRIPGRRDQSWCHCLASLQHSWHCICTL